MAEQRQRESSRIRQLKERQAQKDRLRALHQIQHPEADHHIQSHTAPQFNTNPILEKSHSLVNKSNWKVKQRIKYLVFLNFYSDITFFGSDLKSIPTFKCMGQFINTRSPEQAKSFHLSNKKIFGNHQELIAALTNDLKNQQGFQKLLDRYENQIIQFDKQSNFLSDHFLTMKKYFLRKINKNQESDQKSQPQQQKKIERSYNSKINISDLMKEKSYSELQNRQYNDSKISKGQQGFSQEPHPNSYNSNQRFMDRQIDYPRNKYDFPPPGYRTPPQMDMFNPYVQMTKAQMDSANQMNLFQMQQMYRQRMYQQQNQDQQRQFLSMQQVRKANTQQIKNPVAFQQNNPYYYPPTINTAYSPYLDNRFIQNRNMNINMNVPRIPQGMGMPPGGIPNMPQNITNSSINSNQNAAQTPRFATFELKQGNKNTTNQILKQKNSQKESLGSSDKEVVMSDERKKLVQTCHQHWTKWLKGVIELKARQEKKQRSQQQQIDVNQ